MKKARFLVALVLALSMLLCVASAGDSYTINTADMFPVIAEDNDVSLEIAIMTGASDGDLETMWFPTWLEKNSNLDLTFTRIEDSSWSTRKALLLASEELPDVFWGFSWTNYDFYQYGMTDGYFADLTEAVAQYADNLNEMNEWMGDEGFLALARTPDGKMYSMPKQTGTGIATLNGGQIESLTINKEWLAAVNMEIPTTTQELYDVLVAFRDADLNGNGDPTDEIPFSAIYDAAFRAEMLGMYGFITNGDQSNNIAVQLLPDGTRKAAYMPYTAEYREYLETMNKWYTEGLLDQDMFTQDAIQMAAKNLDYGAGVLHEDYQKAIGEVPEIYQKYEAFVVTTSEDITPAPYVGSMARAGGVVISADCEYVDAAVRLMDSLYDPYIAMNNWNGPQVEDEAMYDDYAKELGIGYTMIVNVGDDGNITLDYPQSFRNPEVYDNDSYFLCDLVRGGNTGLIANAYWRMQVYGADPSYASTDIADGYWRLSVRDNVLRPYATFGYPNVFLSGEEMEQAEAIKTQLEDYVYTMEAQFINGALSIEEEYDNFIKGLEDLGVVEYQDIYDRAYEAYLNNL